jgi:hypothetical protein
VLAAEQHILGDRQVRGERELLVDDGDPEALGRERAVDHDRLAVEPDLAARIGLVGPGQDLHQGRLAGPVLAHQGVNLARVDLQRDVRKGFDARKGLGNAAHLQDRLRRGRNVRRGPSLRRAHRELPPARTVGPRRAAASFGNEPKLSIPEAATFVVVQ